MARVGDRFQTGQTCETSGLYVFDGYTDGTTIPLPPHDEQIIPSSKDQTFRPIHRKRCWWKLKCVS